jgi:hypothetical protein
VVSVTDIMTDIDVTAPVCHSLACSGLDGPCWAAWACLCLCDAWAWVSPYSNTRTNKNS